MSDREFRVIKKTRGGESRYFPQYRYKRWSGMWWFCLIDGGNGWQYWMGDTTYAGEYTSFIPVKFVAREEAESFITRQREVDEDKYEVVS